MSIKSKIKQKLTPSAVTKLNNIRYEIHLARVRFLNKFSPSRRSVRNRIREMDNVMLHWGCGRRKLDGWLNIDGWPSDATDYVHDLRTQLPLGNESAEMVFTEHVLEHVEFNIGEQVLADFLRVLKPGGRLRIIVPGLRQYCDAYMSGEKEWFAKVDSEPATVGHGLNAIFYSHFHRCIYDFEMLEEVLLRIGFSSVTESSHNASEEPQLRIDTDNESRRLQSLYVEAVK